MEPSIFNYTHPEFDGLSTDYYKWRLTYRGGRDFINQYLRRMSNRETNDEFNERKNMTYSPSFAKAAVNDVRNAIYKRLGDVSREGGSQSYIDAMAGDEGGVDFHGTSMSNFVGMTILKELLCMRKVGVYVDMPEFNGYTLKDQANKRPYLYTYAAEDIRSWGTEYPGQGNEFSHVLLQDQLLTVDPNTGLSTSMFYRYRFVKKVAGGITVKFYDNGGSPIDVANNKADTEYFLPLPRIPFVVFSLPESLLQDVADYQIALLNLESSDMQYVRKGNFPFYTEQYNPALDAPYKKQPQIPYTDSEGNIVYDAASSGVTSVETGPSHGRRYPLGAERPGFISPSSEPLVASMAKCKQLKDDIRTLVNLAVSNLISSKESTGADKFDSSNYESGLKFIGETLCKGERLIASYWDMYEKTGKIADVAYPENYETKSDADREAYVNALLGVLPKIPSKTCQKELAKRVSYELLNGKVPDSVIKTIYKEIDSAVTMTTDAATIIADHEAGLVDDETASQARGYPEGTVEKAREDHAERLALQVTAQTALTNQVGPDAKVGGQAEGNPAGEMTRETSSQEKVGKAQRGEARL